MKRLLYIITVVFLFTSCKKVNDELLPEKIAAENPDSGIEPVPEYEWTSMTVPPNNYPAPNGTGIIIQANNRTFYVKHAATYFELNNNTKLWQQLGHDYDFFASFGTGLQYFFSYGTKIYYGMNRYADSTGHEFGMWDVTTHTLTTLPAFPGTPVSDPTCFVIGNKGYITGGYNNQNGTLQNQLWEFNFTTNQWVNKGNSPLGARGGAIAMVVNDKAYLGLGYSYIYLNNQQIKLYKNDWILYDPNSVYSIIKADFPGDKRAYTKGFVLNNSPYIGFGNNATNYYKDFWKYNTSSNTWIQQQSWPGSNITSWYQVVNAFSIGSTGYVVKGGLYEFWRFSNSPFIIVQ